VALSVVIILKGLAEFIGLMLVAQGLVFVLSFGKHEGNAIYRGIRFLNSPVLRVTRAITPNVIVDRHVPAVAVFIVVVCWFLLTVAKAVLHGPPVGA
jgi:hypothetical protein